MKTQCKLRRAILRSVGHCQRGKRSCCYLTLNTTETLFVSHDYSTMLVVKWPSPTRKVPCTFYIETDSIQRALRVLKGDDLLFKLAGATARLTDGKKFYPLNLTAGFVGYDSVLRQERRVLDEYDVCLDRATRLFGTIGHMQCESVRAVQ